MKKYFEFLFELDSETKKNTFLIFTTYFLVLFSYPLVRSSTGTLFYEVYSAGEYSLASFIGVAVLMVLIMINNKLQPMLGIQKVYLFTGIVTVGGFIAAYLAFNSGVKEAAFILFAIKESYIVLLVHLCLAFANSYYPIDLFKRIIGPIGAMGSIGGILGGQLTSYLASKGHKVLNADKIQINKPNVDYLNVDVTDASQVFSSMSAHMNRDELRQSQTPAGYDAVVHFAAIPRILQSSDIETYKVNVKGTYNIFECAIKLGIKKIIFASSETVYGLCFSHGKPAPLSLPIAKRMKFGLWTVTPCLKS